MRSANIPLLLLGALLSTLVQAAPSRSAPPAARRAQEAPAPAAAPANKLDTAQIRRLYLEGEFDQSIEAIEDALRYGGPFSHADSVFMFKHLGVMFAARYETREKGKAYMFQLLNVEPTAKILDMYASDMIYMIFKNIQDEFHSSRPLDPALPRNDTSSAVPRPKQARSRAWIGWAAGTAAAVGGIALTWHLLQEEESPGVKVLPGE